MRRFFQNPIRKAQQRFSWFPNADNGYRRGWHGHRQWLVKVTRLSTALAESLALSPKRWRNQPNTINLQTRTRGTPTLVLWKNLAAIALEQSNYWEHIHPPTTAGTRVSTSMYANARFFGDLKLTATQLVRINFAEVNALSSSRKASSATALSPKVEQKETSLDPGDLVLKRVVVGILQAFVNDENNAEAPTIVFSPDDSSRPTTHPLPSDAQTGQDQFQESNTRNLGGQTKLTKLLSQASILLATIHPEDAGRVLKTINPLNEHSRWPLAPISELILFMCRILKAGRIIL